MSEPTPLPGSDSAEPAPAAPGGRSAAGSTPHPTERAPGWREVLLVSAAVVLVVLGAAVLTGFLPTDLQRVIFHEPLLIAILVLGTIVVLWGVARRNPPE